MHTYTVRAYDHIYDEPAREGEAAYVHYDAELTTDDRSAAIAYAQEMQRRHPQREVEYAVYDRSNQCVFTA